MRAHVLWRLVDELCNIAMRSKYCARWSQIGHCFGYRQTSSLILQNVSSV